MTGFKIPPPANWRPELKGCNRAWHWQRAAGLKKDGNSKNRGQHAIARKSIIFDERLRLIHLKGRSEWTPEDHIFMDTEKCRKMTVFHQRRGYLKNPEVRHKNNLRSIARDARIRKEKMDTVTKFISDNNLDVCTGVLSDEDAFQYIVELMDDKTTAIGKDIFDALGGMTL